MGLLANPLFLRLWLNGAISGTVRWLEVLAVGLYALETTGSALIVSLMLFARQLPTLLFGAWLGALAEQVNRRRLYAGMMFVLAAASGTLVTLAHYQLLSLWHVAIGAFLTGTCWTLEMPVRRTLLGDLAGRDAMAAAMSLDSSTNNATRMLGPLVGGTLYAIIGLSGTYAVTCALFVVAFVNLATLGYSPPSARVAGEPMLALVREGIVYIRGNPTLAGIMVVTVVVNLFGFAYAAMIPVIGERNLSLGPAAIGALAAVEGFGALVGAMLCAFTARVHHFTRIFTVGAIVYLAMIAVFSASGSLALSATALLTGGLGLAGFAAMQSAILLTSTPAALRGRVMGVLMVCIGAAPLGVVQLGWLAHWLGAAQAVHFTSLLGLACLFACVWRFPSLLQAPVPPPDMPSGQR